MNEDVSLLKADQEELKDVKSKLSQAKKSFDEKTKTLKNIETSVNEAALKNNQLKEEQTKLDSLLKDHYIVLEEKDNAASELKTLENQLEGLIIEKDDIKSRLKKITVEFEEKSELVSTLNIELEDVSKDLISKLEKVKSTESDLSLIHI